MSWPRWCLKGVGHCCGFALKLLLALGFLVLLAAILAWVFYRGLPINPAFLRGQEFGPGIRLQAREVVLRPDGTLHLRGVRAQKFQGELPLLAFYATGVETNLNWHQGHVALSALEVHNGSLTVAAALSPTGSEFPLIEQARVRVSGTEQLLIEQAFARVLGADVAVRGSIPLNLDFGSSDEGSTWAASLRDSLHEWVHWLEIAEPLEDASAVIRVRARDDGADVSLLLTAHGWQSPRLKMGPAWLAAEADWTRLGSRASFQLELLQPKLQIPKPFPWATRAAPIASEALQAGGAFAFAKDGALAKGKLRAVAFSPHWGAIDLDLVHANFACDTLGSVDPKAIFSVSAAKGRESLSAEGFASFDGIEAELTSWIDGPAWLKRLGMAKSPRLQALAQAGPGRINATLKLGPDGQFREVAGEAVLPGLMDPPLHAEWVLPHFLVSPELIHIFDTTIDRGDWQLVGSYFQNLENMDYRVTGWGDFAPDEVTGLVAADWWEEFWQRFELAGPYPYVDFDLRGRFNGGRAFRWLLASTTMSEIGYQGQAVDEASAQVLMLPETLDIIGLRGRKDDRWLKLDARSRTLLGGSDRVSLAVAGQSTFNLSEAGQLLGDVGEDYGWIFQQQVPASLGFAGLFFGEDSDAPGAHYLKARARLPDSVQLGPARLDSLALELVQRPGRMLLRDVRAGIGRGTLTASIDIQNDGTADSMRAHFAVDDARYEEVIAAFQPPLPPTPGGYRPVRGLKREESRFDAGKIDLRGRIVGPLGELERLSGSGEISLDEANLGPIELLGPGGQFELDAGGSSWELDRGYLHFPDIWLANEASRVSANGFLYWPTQQLNFHGTLSPFGSVRTPVLAQLLNTFGRVSQVVEIRLQGTTSVPDWNFALRPIGLLTGPSEAKVPEQAEPPAPVSQDESPAPDPTEETQATPH